MKPEELAKSIEKGDLRPLYYLYGDESYLVERGGRQIVSAAVSDDLRDFNLNVFYGNECSGEQILSAALTMPMFAPRRAVLVKNAGKLSPAALDTLLSYLADPSLTTTVVFLGEKIDQRKKFFLELKKRDALVEFRRLYENQLLPFVSKEILRLGKKIQPGAAEMLLGMSGSNLQELVSQMEKVAVYVGERQTVEIEDIRAIVSGTRVDSVFDLANAIGERDPRKALSSLRALLDDGEAPLMILSMLARHFRQIWKVRDLSVRKLPVAEIAKSAGINPYFINGIQRQASKFQTAELALVFERIFELDLRLKSGCATPDVLMERLVLEICGERNMAG
jgi:DNA polymerase-3 subunit delta